MASKEVEELREYVGERGNWAHVAAMFPHLTDMVGRLLAEPPPQAWTDAALVPEKVGLAELKEFRELCYGSILNWKQSKLFIALDRFLADPPQAKTDNERALCDYAKAGMWEWPDAMKLLQAVYEEQHPPKPRTVADVERDMVKAVMNRSFDLESLRNEVLKLLDAKA